LPDQPESRISARLERQISAWRDESQFRTLQIPSGINLCSNDYLGLATDPRLKQATLEAVARASAVGSTGSRLMSGNSADWEHLESEFAEFAGTEAALYFGSGFAANAGLLGAILKPGDVVFSDELNHASLIDGIRLSRAKKVIYPHCDMQALERNLRQHADAPGARLIVTESIFSMEGDVAPLDSLLRLARDFRAECIVDEAHATGTYGAEGRGVAAEQGCQRELLATIHTCGKALASAGGFVCGGSTLRDFLVNRARTFVFSTAMPPYLAGQIRAALHLAQEAEVDRAHLREMGELLRRELTAARLTFGTSSTQIVPILLGSNDRALHVAAELQKNDYAVKAIRPPTVPSGTSRIRVSLTKNITRENISGLVAGLREAIQSAPNPSSAHVVHA